MQNIETETQKPIARVETDLESLIPSFLNNRKRDIADLRAAVKAKDFASLERIGHILKGVSASYGFDKLGEYGASLESNARTKSLAECSENVELMDTYMRDVVVVFE